MNTPNMGETGTLVRLMWIVAPCFVHVPSHYYIILWNQRRDELFDQIREGRITPAQADALASSEGLKPLLPRSDPAMFDPSILSTWTVTMALAWIIWRCIDEVREFYTPWRQLTPYWGHFEYVRWENGVRIETQGYELTERKAAGLIDLHLNEIWHKHAGELARRAILTRVEAERTLWKLAQDGKLVGVGFDHENIPAGVLTVRAAQPLRSKCDGEEAATSETT